MVYLTAHSDNALLRQAKITEPYGYLLKPIQNRELHATIEMALYKHELDTKLKENERWLDTTLQSIGDAVIATDEKGCVTLMNTVAEKLTGWQQEEALGHNLTQVFHIVNEITGTPVENPVEEVIREETVVGPANHTLLIKKDGTVIPISDSAAPIQDDKGNITGVVLVFRDITERKRAEEALRCYNEELENQVKIRTKRIRELEWKRAETEKFAATGRMAARIAHEINNPLGGIKNSFLLIKDAIPADYPHYKYVGLIEDEIDRIARIVRQMFELYRPGQEPANKFPVDKVIGDVVTLLGSNGRYNGVSIELDISEASVVVDMQESLFRQILYNIILNATEASPPGGLVKVAASVTENLTIAVSDQGCGIPKGVSSQIFEPFFTTKNSSKSGGLGLGLSISQNIVEALGGSIDFESETDCGTVFRIILPLNREQKEESND